MARTTAIVPPKPQEVERRVIRRPKTRRALRLCIGAGVLLLAVLVLPTDRHPAPIIALGSLACVYGIAAVVLRFVEKPTEVVLRKMIHERDSPHVLR